MEEMTFANTLITVELDNKLKMVAKAKNISRSEVVRLALEEYLRQFDFVPSETMVAVEKP